MGEEAGRGAGDGEEARFQVTGFWFALNSMLKGPPGMLLREILSGSEDTSNAAIWTAFTKFKGTSMELFVEMAE